eukprot:TRINITY_DN14706_c0_g1_i1.p3 TRINITY_DN14706_c0_g1~~TRINITY_DN14706_c0_g1_i1.p3  ORF type:complete len:185 (-),score=-12.57 TRINITY_DN14706_c0_g1_i1:292-846(-)
MLLLIPTIFLVWKCKTYVHITCFFQLLNLDNLKALTKKVTQQLHNFSNTPQKFLKAYFYCTKILQLWTKIVLNDTTYQKSVYYKKTVRQIQVLKMQLYRNYLNYNLYSFDQIRNNWHNYQNSKNTLVNEKNCSINKKQNSLCKKAKKTILKHQAITENILQNFNVNDLVFSKFETSIDCRSTRP